MTLVDIIFTTACIIVVVIVILLVRGNGERMTEALYPYPLSSKPGDKMFPDKGDKWGWISYITVFIGIILFFGAVGVIFIGKEPMVRLGTIGCVLVSIGMSIQRIKK